MADTSSGETKAQKRAAEAATWADERYHPAGGLRRRREACSSPTPLSR